jgi:phosphoglucomutase
MGGEQQDECRPRRAEGVNDSVHCLMIFYVIINVLSDNYLYLCSRKPKHVRIMTAIQLRAELFREMSPLLDSEAAMEKLIKYVKKLSAKKVDPTLMTEEDFFAKLDEAEREIAEGKGIKMLPNESLDEFLRRVG